MSLPWSLRRPQEVTLNFPKKEVWCVVNSGLLKVRAREGRCLLGPFLLSIEQEKSIRVMSGAIHQPACRTTRPNAHARTQPRGLSERANDAQSAKGRKDRARWLLISVNLFNAPPRARPPHEPRPEKGQQTLKTKNQSLT